jgi:hypothetical protein
MCPCRIISPSSHQGDDENMVASHVEVDNVRKAFESAGPQPIRGDSEMERIISDSLNGSQVLGKEFLAKSAMFVIVPSNSGSHVVRDLRAIRQMPHQ